MSILDDEIETRKEIRAKLAEIVVTEPEELARIKELGTELNFAECVPIFHRIVDLYRVVDGLLDTQDLSLESLEKVNSCVDRTRAVFRSFVQFSLTQPNPNRNLMAERTQLLNTGCGHYNEVFRELAPVIAYCSAKRGRIGAMESQAEEILQKMRDDLDKLEITKDEAKNTLNAVKNLAQQAGVSQHAGIFADEARSHKMAAWWWLGSTILLTAVTAWTGYHFYQVSLQPLDPSKPYSGAQAVQIAVTRVALLSILFTATIWVGRMYRSHRHNAVLNKHRSNALRTFETFAKATTDDSIKNAVLIKATECIFSPQQTGYTSYEQETGGVAQVIEIVRGMAGKTG